MIYIDLFTPVQPAAIEYDLANYQLPNYQMLLDYQLTVVCRYTQYIAVVYDGKLFHSLLSVNYIVTDRPVR